VTVNAHTNDNSDRMSLTSSLWSAAKNCQQPLQPRTAKYINKLAATLLELVGGYTKDDFWEAHKKLRVVAKVTIRVRMI